MGFISTAASGLTKIAAALLFITFLPGLPPTNLNFDSYIVKPALPLTGVLSLNNKLNNAEKLFEGQIKGPESLAIYNNELYTGLHGGYVVKIVNNKIVPVVKYGEKCVYGMFVDGFFEESKCGRPLGLTMDKKGGLYIADAYFGIYKYNITTGKSERLVAADDTIEGKVVKLLNSVAVAKDNTMYYTISSSTFKIEDGLYTTLGNGNGRLMKYDPVSKSNELLLDNLHFANGVIISDDESFLLIAETMMSRLIRYYLKGPKKGTTDILIDRLPGLPDNLQKDDKDGFIVPLVLPVGDDYPCLFQQLSEYPLVRRLFVRLMMLVEIPAATIEKYYPNYCTKVAVHWIGHFETMESMLGKPPRTTIVFLNKDGKITKSLHATDSRISGISDCLEWNGYYYLGSPFNPFLARVKAS